jgi:uncharacterized membrane protein
MYKIIRKKEIPVVSMIVFTIIAGIVVYPDLPTQIPIHWNILGLADKFAQKNIFTALLLPLTALFTYTLMLYIPYLDPKKEKYDLFAKAYYMIRLATISFLCVISCVVYSIELGFNVSIIKVVMVLLSILFIILGNLMGKIRQNWFVGFRIPWTMESEEVWNKTNRMAGRFFVVSGIIGVVGAFLPQNFTLILTLGPILVSVVFSSIYGYVLYIKK